MDLLVLGTGSGRGWPEPGCSCASCLTAVAAGTSRAPSSALVGDALLLDPSADVAAAAARAGADLSQVRAVLLSAASGPAPTLLAALPGVTHVLGPERALAPYRGVARPGTELVTMTHEVVQEVSGHRVRAQTAGDDRLHYDVTAPDGDRLLHAAAGGDVTTAGARGYDAVLMAAGPALAGSLAALRQADLVSPRTQVVALQLGHDLAPNALPHVLGAWGVRVVPDGTRLVVAGDVAVASAPGLPRRTLVLGGARSGKSALAEQLLAAQPSVVYVATGGRRPDDAEWQERVTAHRQRRPARWRTLETTELTGSLRAAQDPLLVDCLGTWLADRLDRHGVWQGEPADAVLADVDDLVAAWRAVPVPVVAVSNEVGSGVVPATASGRLFRDLLGVVNARVAAESESVLLTVAGLAVPLRDPVRV